jgi:hypothetical protein
MGAAAIVGLVGLMGQYSAQQQQKEAYQDQADYERLIGGIQKDLYYSNARSDEIQAGLAAGQAKILSKTADINALGAETEALSIKSNTLDLVTKVKKAGSQIMGSQVSRYLKAGVEMEGTPMVVMKDTANSVETDVANIIASGKYQEHQALGKAFAYTLEGKMAGFEGAQEQNNLMSQATLARIYGLNASIGSAFRVAGYGYQANAIQAASYGTLLTGAANIYSRYYTPGSKAVGLDESVRNFEFGD